ncbi:MAG: tyrosine-type recombinase/integrase [Chroococcidiopsidaceae cyanobacterium CP_BM_RX_35]|nr:tyrosine-type recombinase/integrase [Chroococcidiopsidaceae cyanobacterium CP_BM_RX_35]
MIEPPLTPFLAIAQNNQPLEPLEQVIDLWLHGKSPHTQRYYRREAQKFLTMLGKPLDLITLADVQAYVTVLEKSRLAASSRARAIAAIKSLFSFAYHKTGLLKANPAGPVTAPRVKDALAERILSESDVQMMIRLEPNLRNQLLLRLMYIAGLRVSELTQLQWSALQTRDVGGQVLIYGKGGKTRTIKLPALLWQELQELREDEEIDAPVFTSRKQNGHLTEVQVNRIVKAAAMRVPGLDKKVAAKVSAHWLRHAHASHAMDRGAPVHLVKETLGHANVATTGRYLHAQPTDSSSLYLES